MVGNKSICAEKNNPKGVKNRRIGEGVWAEIMALRK